MFIIFTMSSSKQWNMKSSGMKCKWKNSTGEER
jgi:hypothetical protein